MNPEVQAKFESYPLEARAQLVKLRRHILVIAKDKGLGRVEESLKWGQVSFFVKGGSPIRIGWNRKDPDVIKLYFNCQTSLVETFKEIYKENLKFEGKRAIVIPLNTKIEIGPLGHCIGLALVYHSVKHLPLLGV